MSRNIDAVQAIYEAFGRSHAPATLARLAPDVAREHDWGGETLRWFESRRGRDGVPAFFATIADFSSCASSPSRSSKATDVRSGRHRRGVPPFRRHHFVDTRQWAGATRT